MESNKYRIEGDKIFEKLPECVKCNSAENVKDERELSQRGSLIVKKYLCQKCNITFWVVIGDISKQ